MSVMDKLRDNKVFKILKGIINVFLVVFIILFVLIVLLQRVTDNKMSFFNYRMFTVISGSMEPRYVIGDVLIAKETEPEDIKVGDTISYLGKVGHFQDKVITHKVVNIEKDENNKYLFHTKGLANIVEDPIVHEDQLFGVVTYKSVILSGIYKIIGNTFGMFVLVIIPIFYIIGSEMISMLLEREEKRRNKE